MNSRKSVAVIGGGAAGMIAAIAAARDGHRVDLIEKNNKLGKKLYITGKGRCNLTNASDVETLLKNVLTNRKFLYSAFYGFDSDMLIAFFEELGLKTKIERGNRVFPLSERASDVIRTLERALQDLDVHVMLHTEVRKLKIDGGQITGVFLSDGSIVDYDAVIVATGGVSYDMTGSTGDGYRFAAETGHKVAEIAPGLVPIETKEPWVTELQGLSLKNVVLKLYQQNGTKKKCLFDEMGEMIFTHFGLSGPLVLSCSSLLPKNDYKGLTIELDLKPSLDEEQLDQRLLRDFEKYNRKDFINALDDLLPQKIIPILVNMSQIPERIKVDQVTREQRKNFINLLKHLTCTVKGPRDYNEAIITRGGVDVKNINPNTMESKTIKNLFFAGEVLDLDAVTGGFNLQIAFSTGYLAGKSIE